MNYSVPFIFHNKSNVLMVDYRPMQDAFESGFHILNLPFAADFCSGYPMVHARFDQLNLQGYERYCGFIQFIRREEYDDLADASPSRVLYEIDVPDDLREKGTPYFAYGYPAELFDAPCRNLRDSKKLIWRAYTYLVDIPSRINGNQLSYLAGFSWGYTENVLGEVTLLDFQLLNQADWEAHRQYLA